MNRTAEVLLGALATALLCTIWMFFANHTGLLGWGGFAGRAEERPARPSGAPRLRCQRYAVRLWLPVSREVLPG